MTSVAAGIGASPVISRVMVTVAHPDDAESHAAGTVAKFVRRGTAVAYVLVTDGDKGSRDRTMTPERLADIRRREQREAAAVLGVYDVEFLGYPDCEVEDTRALRRDLTRAIRRFKPDLVIVQNPNRTYDLGASHRDHRIVGGAALDCIYPLARDPLAFPELLPAYEPHTVREVYVMHVARPQLVIDISETILLKVEALARHRSQVGENMTAVEASVRERSARVGQPYGIPYAEVFDRIVIER